MRLSREMLVVLLTLSLLSVACRQLSPEERVESLRAQYTAKLNSFYVEPPAGAEMEEMEATEEGEEAAAEEAAPEGEEGEGEEMATEEAMPKNVVLDILVSTEAMEYLPGLTVDVYQADTSGNEKDHWRLWLDTSGVVRGPGAQITKVLEDVDYEEGDAFAVEVRQSIPPEERSEYRELEQAS